MSSQQSPVFFSEQDPQMERASARARQTFRFFWREMAWERRRIIPGLDVACVKVAFSDPPGCAAEGQPSVEQMWINDVDFDGQQASGTLINSPNWITSVKEGDHVAIPPQQLGDWMYAIQGKAYGAYTVNLIRSRMSRSERAEHDEAWGLDFGDPQKIQIVPPDFLGAKPAGFFNRLLGGGEQNPDEVATHEHPMALNMTQSLEEFVRKDPANLTTADERGFTMLHQLALAGAAAGVALLLKHGANPSLKARNGMTPLQLAQSLGWGNVIALLNAR